MTDPQPQLQRTLKAALPETLLTSIPGMFHFDIGLYPAAGDDEEQLAFFDEDHRLTQRVRLADGDIWAVLEKIDESYEWTPPSLRITVVEHLQQMQPVRLVVLLEQHRFRITGIRTM